MEFNNIYNICNCKYCINNKYIVYISYILIFVDIIVVLPLKNHQEIQE